MTTISANIDGRNSTTFTGQLLFKQTNDSTLSRTIKVVLSTLIIPVAIAIIADLSLYLARGATGLVKSLANRVSCMFSSKAEDLKVKAAAQPLAPTNVEPENKSTPESLKIKDPVQVAPSPKEEVPTVVEDEKDPSFADLSQVVDSDQVGALKDDESISDYQSQEEGLEQGTVPHEGDPLNDTANTQASEEAGSSTSLEYVSKQVLFTLNDMPKEYMQNVLKYWQFPDILSSLSENLPESDAKKAVFDALLEYCLDVTVSSEHELKVVVEKVERDCISHLNKAGKKSLNKQLEAIKDKIRDFHELPQDELIGLAEILVKLDLLNT